MVHTYGGTLKFALDFQMLAYEWIMNRGFGALFCVTASERCRFCQLSTPLDYELRHRSLFHYSFRTVFFVAHMNSIIPQVQTVLISETLQRRKIESIKTRTAIFPKRYLCIQRLCWVLVWCTFSVAVAVPMMCVCIICEQCNLQLKLY